MKCEICTKNICPDEIYTDFYFCLYCAETYSMSGEKVPQYCEHLKLISDNCEYCDKYIKQM